MYIAQSHNCSLFFIILCQFKKIDHSLLDIKIVPLKFWLHNRKYLTPQWKSNCCMTSTEKRCRFSGQLSGIQIVITSIVPHLVDGPMFKAYPGDGLRLMSGNHWLISCRFWTCNQPHQHYGNYNKSKRKWMAKFYLESIKPYQSVNNANMFSSFKVTLDWFICWYFNAPFKHNFSNISWPPVFICGQKARVPRENHWPSIGKLTIGGELRLELSAATKAGFELTTSVLAGSW